MNLIEFGSIAHIQKGKKPLRQIDHPQVGYMPYVDIEAFEKGNIKTYTDGEKCLPCKAGEILIVCDGSRSGFVGRAIDGYVGSTLAVISADGMSTDYLYYFLQGKYALLNTKKKGTGTPHLDQQILFQQKLIVPSLEEQERIVARIEELFSELDNGVETLRKTKQQLAVYRQAVLKNAFEGAFTTGWRADNREFTAENIWLEIVEKKKQCKNVKVYEISLADQSMVHLKNLLKRGKFRLSVWAISKMELSIGWTWFSLMMMKRLKNTDWCRVMCYLIELTAQNWWARQQSTVVSKKPFLLVI